ncbi:MAG TPA: serine/threonine-protein kinase [Gemmatimonadaceae bacterium]|nr:serine/threonine-protein kinase [Gemmatimonadaceae bacterium]
MTVPDQPDSTTPWTPSAPKVCPLCGTTYGADVLFCARDGSTLTTPGASDLVGQVIADRYRILERLGEGAMGRVFLAEHVKMGRRCAIKVMNRALMTDHEAIGRFNREATNASRVLHPNVAAIYDFGETSDGLIYLAMEVVEGEPLSAICDREKILPAARAVEITRQIAEGLTAAHDLGIVHRDLKPANIMVARAKDGRDVVKIVDFGIAKGGEGGEGQEVTRTGFVVGTPEYMSPEQLAGSPLDGRSDLFAVGCILYKMLTGESSFAGTSIESRIQRRIVGAPAHPRASNPEVPVWLDEVTVKAMARDPDVRFQSAAAMRDALVMGMASTSQRRLTMTMPLPVPLSRISRRFWFGAGAVAGVTILVSLGMSWRHSGGDERAAATQPRAVDTTATTPAAPEQVAPAQSSSSPASSPATLASTGAAPSGAPSARSRAADSLAALAQVQLLDAQRRALDARQRAAAAGATARELAHGDAVMRGADDDIRARRYAAAVSAMTEAQRGWEEAARVARARAESLAANTRAHAAAAPPTPAESSAPPTPAPAAPAAPVDPTPELQGLLARYASALATRDIDRVRAAYPGMTSEEVKRWSDVFDATTAVGATLTPSGPAHVTGNTAELKVDAAFAFTYRRGIDGDRHPTATYRATFTRDGAGWRLTALR